MIEIWERVQFKGPEPTHWEQSIDGGRTWKTKPWWGSKLPFVRLDFSGTWRFEEPTPMQQRAAQQEINAELDKVTRERDATDVFDALDAYFAACNWTWDKPYRDSFGFYSARNPGKYTARSAT
jgi:hypothetical protein